MSATLAVSLPQEVVDVEPGDFWLPTLRRFTRAGAGPAVALAEATSDDLSAAELATLKFRRDVLDATDEQLRSIKSEQLRRLNGAA